MPKLDPKSIQKELQQGSFRPVYWLYGQERLKIRELLKRIRRAVLGIQEEGKGRGESVSQSSWRELTLDAAETEASFILDEAHSPSLMPGTRLIIIRDAHLLKNPEILTEILGPPRPLSELTSVCIFISKDLDARKKFSKILNDKAAVVPCEEVPEQQRESWISYLAKRREMELSPDLLLKLSFLDPWSLDIVDQELEKMAVDRASQAASSDILFGISGNGSENGEVEIAGLPSFRGSTDSFLESFFRKDLGRALPWAGYFSDHPDESIPLLGLLGWNVKQLALLISERETQIPAQLRLNPYLSDRLKKWSQLWTLNEILDLQRALFSVDFSVKQTRLLPLGIWTTLIVQFCRIDFPGNSSTKNVHSSQFCGKSLSH